jgi:hypothetical protein
MPFTPDTCLEVLGAVGRYLKELEARGKPHWKREDILYEEVTRERMKQSYRDAGFHDPAIADLSHPEYELHERIAELDDEIRSWNGYPRFAGPPDDGWRPMPADLEAIRRRIERIQAYIIDKIKGSPLDTSRDSPERNGEAPGQGSPTTLSELAAMLRTKSPHRRKVVAFLELMDSKIKDKRPVTIHFDDIREKCHAGFNVENDTVEKTIKEARKKIRLARLPYSITQSGFTAVVQKLPV